MNGLVLAELTSVVTASVGASVWIKSRRTSIGTHFFLVCLHRSSMDSLKWTCPFLRSYIVWTTMGSLGLLLCVSYTSVVLLVCQGLSFFRT